MFSKKHAPPDYSELANSELLRFLDRVETLSETAGNIQNFINMKSLEWDANVSEIRRSIRFIHDDLNQLKKRMEFLKKKFIATVSDFRVVADRDQIKKLEQRIDALPIEKYITKNEFERLAKEKKLL